MKMNKLKNIEPALKDDDGVDKDMINVVEYDYTPHDNLTRFGDYKGEVGGNIIDVDTEYYVDRYGTRHIITVQLGKCKPDLINKPDKIVPYIQQHTKVYTNDIKYKGAHAEIEYSDNPLKSFIEKTFNVKTVTILPPLAKLTNPQDIILTGHLLTVDLMPVFDTNNQRLIENAIKSGHIVDKNTLKIDVTYKGNKRSSFINISLYIKTKEKNVFKPIRIGLYDSIGTLGVTSLKNFIDIAGIPGFDQYKDILDDRKHEMHNVLIENPDDFIKYAKNDCIVSYGKLIVENLFDDLYVQLGCENKKQTRGGNPFEEIQKYPTIGRRVMSMLSRYIHNQDSEIESSSGLSELVDIETGKAVDYNKTRKEFMKIAAAPSYLINDPAHTKGILGKVIGGRAFNSKPFLTSLPKGRYVELDLSGAYNKVCSLLPIPIGNPAVYSVPNKGMKIDYITLEKFLEVIEYDENNELTHYFLAVVTNKKLDFDNYYIPSFKDQLKEYFYDTEESVLKFTTQDLEATTRIFKNEIENGFITHEVLALLEAVLGTVGYNKFLKDSVVRAAIVYPVKNYKPVISLEGLVRGNSGVIIPTFKNVDGNIITGYQDSTSKDWTLRSTNEMSSKIRELRSQYDKSSSQNKQFKLVGNTLYGAMVSQYNGEANVVLGNRITANVRTTITAYERTLNAFNTTTDSVHCDLNRVFNHNNQNGFQPLFKYTFVDNYSRYGFKLDSIDENVDVIKEHVIKHCASNRLQKIVSDHDIEIKHSAESLVIHGVANRKHGDLKPKMRGYKDRGIVDKDYKPLEESFQEKMFREMKANPNKVSKPEPYQVLTIIKAGAYKEQYEAFAARGLTLGDTYYQVKKPVLFNISSFTFRDDKEYRAFSTMYISLKQCTGWSLEGLFYDVDTGTVRFQDLLTSFNKSLSSKVPIRYWKNELKTKPYYDNEGVKMVYVGTTKYPYRMAYPNDVLDESIENMVLTN
jgi:hypothetical protein